jgi:hypothetical protein
MSFVKQFLTQSLLTLNRFYNLFWVSKIPPCPECCILSFGWYPVVLISYADISEHCSFFLLIPPMKMCSETSAYKIQTRGNQPKDRIQDSTIICLLLFWVLILLVHVLSLLILVRVSVITYVWSLFILMTSRLIVVGMSSSSCLVLGGTSVITYVVLTGRRVITFLWFLLLCHHLLLILALSTIT